MKDIIGKNSHTFEDIAVIEKLTGGKIGKYEWWYVKGIDEVFHSLQEPKNKEDIVSHDTLENSFLCINGEYIGDLERAEWYVSNKLKVYNPYPHGVAELMDENDEIEGYVGYTHRGAGKFKVGDRIFDEDYEPKEQDYTPEQWEEFTNEYNKILSEAEEEGDEWWINDIKRDGISRVIPFRMRGEKIIETMSAAAEAAKNMSKYLS
jgi:hypothetical protein